MIKKTIIIFPITERYPELGKLVYAKYNVADGNWFPVRLFYDNTLDKPFYWQDLTEPEGNDEVAFECFTHWYEIPKLDG